MAMKKANTGMNGFQAILELRKAELVQVLRRPDGIAIEKSADQMDEIQYASERDLAILNVDRESTMLRDVKAALRRMNDGGFGICVNCELAISPKRLEAVPVHGEILPEVGANQGHQVVLGLLGALKSCEQNERHQGKLRHAGSSCGGS
jgi:DnaK suppressor protein